MSHTCHAVACEQYIPPTMLMCRQHWFMVPLSLRNKVWAAYRDGQCDTLDPSSAYCKTAKAAVIAVAEKEGRVIDPKDPKILLYDMLQVSDD
jgi:hypothetical protein